MKKWSESGKKWPESGKMASFLIDFGSGQVSQVLKLKNDNWPAEVGLVRSEPTSNR